MDFLDEKVVEQRRKQMKEEFQILSEGIYVGDAWEEFSRIELFDSKMAVMIPASYVLMDEQAAKLKYPSEQRPQVIYSNPEGDVNFTFSLFDTPITDRQVMQAIDQFQLVIKKIQPANIFYEKKQDPLNGSVVGWFDFKGYALDDQIYTMMYVTPIDGKVMHGIFNCRFSESLSWKHVALQLMQSIEDQTRRK